MSSASPFFDHLHKVQGLSPHEISERLSSAKEQCRVNGARLTPLRQQIYALILQANEPIGAYDLISQLQQTRLIESLKTPSTISPDTKRRSSKNVAPPTVYRSLGFLLAEGLIHQLTSINAYVPCCHPRAQHTAAFLICNQCQRVQECSSLPVQEMVRFAKQEVGFLVTQSVIELSGRCSACQ